MTERRLGTEDFAAPRGAAEHDGAIVPQRDGVVVPQRDEQRDDRPVDRHDDRYGTADEPGGQHHAVDDRGFGGREPGGHDWNDGHDRVADRDDAEPNAVEHDTVGHDTGEHDTVEPDAVEHDRVDRGPVEPSAVSTTAGDTPLFTDDDSANFRTEWRALQADFVDDPREAVRRADELVAQVIQNLATTFAERKSSLEGQWQQGEQVDTEELRQALKRYRSFFDRLLSV
jgi:hypothetical protein